MSRYDNLKPIDSVRMLKIDGVTVGYVSTLQWTTINGEEAFWVYETQNEADNCIGNGKYVILPAGTKWELWRV